MLAKLNFGPSTNVVAAVGYLAGDRYPDIIWQHPETGELELWLMKPELQKVVMGTLKPGWAVKGIGWYKGDSKGDILLQHRVTGEVAVWYMDGARPISDAVIIVSTAWSVGTSADLRPAVLELPKTKPIADVFAFAAADLDGDRRADRVVVNKSTGRWYVRLTSGTDPARIGIPWGWRWQSMSVKSLLALGDYDGDGKTDRAIVDPIGGTWSVLPSSGIDPASLGIPSGWKWGGLGPHHVLALGDYDGDGRTDRAIVDPLAGAWYVLPSSGVDSSAIGIPWGWKWSGMGAQHVLALGDYDGDRRTDRAIVDSAAGTWHVLPSSGVDPSVLRIPWGARWPGQSGVHALALGDYDGDGRTDRAIVDHARGYWHVLLSSGQPSSAVGIPWKWAWTGMGSFHELALADYDGDGRTDRSIVDPNDGFAWYVIPSTGGGQFPWGDRTLR